MHVRTALCGAGLTQKTVLAFALAVSSASLFAARAEAANPGPSIAATGSGTAAESGKGSDDSLEQVVITGSLIPQTHVQDFTPVLTISSEEIQAKGFADIAEALQRTAFSTGSIQNGQFAGFTQGAKVVSFFGLDPSFTKYLLNGTPMATYPALYNGTNNFVSISGIPTVLVDHIDILPGAQSSIYGSDAIAGVVNVVMKQHMDGPMIDARYGFTQNGGGTDRRVAIGDGISIGNFHLVGGLQYESTAPIWAYQRSETAQFFRGGSTPQAAYPDYEVSGLASNSYFEDPANCANVASQFGKSVGLYNQSAPVAIGQYCGSLNAGYYTLQNADEQVQVYLHGSYDVNDHLQIYAETLVSHDVVRFGVAFGNGIGEWNSSFDSSSPLSYYEDPSVSNSDYLNTTHVFSPEEAGGLTNNMDKDTNNSVRATLGVAGAFGSSWKWLADMTYTDNKLTEATHLQFTNPIEAFFSNYYGPNLGYDTNLGANLYQPNYALFYQPITTAQYDSFSGYANSYSYTEESLARAQVTNSALFELPGGKAGFAAQIEGGDQGWNYAPDPRFIDRETFGYTSTAGSGHRSRYAAITELQLPVVRMLKLNVSGRFDDYRVSGDNVDKATYNLGLEFRPLQQVLLRARYGTAFKAPTLADEYQGVSGYYQNLTDYYTCAQEGYTPATLGNCPQANAPLFATTSGNTKLAPITAKVWDLGFVVSPVDTLTVNFDYIHYALKNEIASADANKLLETESACRLGQLDATSPTCVAALADVVRSPSGAITSLYTPKENVSNEAVGTFIAGANYKYEAGWVGTFDVDAEFTDMLIHNFQQFAGDPVRNYLDSPFYSTEFKTKGNVSVTWTKDPVSVTAYVERYGRSPNYVATLFSQGYATPGAGTVAPWTLVDFSVRYHPIEGLEVSVALNNAFNRMPPTDNSYYGNLSMPYDEFNYNVYGRQYYLTATYKMSP
jgi:iron complex outermembrane receptor protein